MRWVVSAIFITSTVIGTFFGPLRAAPVAAPALEKGWENPPLEARLRAYWWWLNGNVTAESITRDLEQMKAKGFAGAVIVDANGAQQEGNAPVPHGPTFLSPEWRALYKHALQEAHRLGLELSLNIQSGWNLGGPSVTADDAAKTITWAEFRTNGPTHMRVRLPEPKSREHYYRDTFLVAYLLKTNAPPHQPLMNWRQKALYEPLRPFSAPISTPLFEELPEAPGEADVQSSQVVDLTTNLAPGGELEWDVPGGEWQFLRFGCTIGPQSYVSTSSDGWHGYAIDVFDDGAFDRYWQKVVEPLLADAGPLAGTALKYLHTDSWEIEGANWTPSLAKEFHARNGYNFVPYLPALAGRIVNGRQLSDRFLADYRKTLGDLTIDHHYKLFRDYAHRHHLQIHPESGGPHAVAIDAQRDLGWDDAPMSEFWAASWEHRIGDTNRFFMKQPASAAHTYGHNLVFGEGFTSIGPHWQSRLADNLKPAFDKALCEGLNVLVWHAFVDSPASMGMPGQQYFAGTHLNPNDTWWPMSVPFFDYINRCQFMLQRGLPISDVLYYYGDHVPNFTQLRSSDPARLGPGYDYDVITEEAILQRLTFTNGQWTLPNGVAYRVLVLPNYGPLSLPVLRKLKELVSAGGVMVGAKPTQASGLKDYPECDREVHELTTELWGSSDESPAEHRFGKGLVIAGKTAREVLERDGIGPDFSSTGSPTAAELTYIHRRESGADIYFIANRGNKAGTFQCSFRIGGKEPELWDPVSGKHWIARQYALASGSTTLPLELPSYGSIFVVFRKSQSGSVPTVKAGNFPEMKESQQITGPWQVSFDAKWGGPANVSFERLTSWTDRPEPGVKYYSGTAVYQKSFNLSGKPAQKHLWIDLGDVRELAEVKVNGKTLGIVWAPPYRVDATQALRKGANSLEIRVVNFWCNRIIGDQFLPPEQRLTQTNVRKLTKNSPLMVSGLLGPVQILQQE